MSSFTRGTWEVQKNAGARKGTTIEIYAVPEEENRLPVKVARVMSDNKEILPDQRMANARLIAHAPEIYELLHEAMQDLQHYETKVSYKKTLWEIIQEELDSINGKE